MSIVLTNREKSVQFKERLALIKETLNSKPNWKTEFFKENPDFDKAYWSKHLQNSLDGAIAPNEQLLIALEVQAEKIKSETLKQS